MDIVIDTTSPEYQQSSRRLRLALRDMEDELRLFGDMDAVQRDAWVERDQRFQDLMAVARFLRL